jgi:hypothetical protein
MCMHILSTRNIVISPPFMEPEGSYRAHKSPPLVMVPVLAKSTNYEPPNYAPFSVRLLAHFLSLGARCCPQLSVLKHR